ncbi:hypothetical protein Acsp06_62940 [Actinomycetospora sp. NBRC 106375]|nr:hypothetical protein Acsp06_62940 [Actinomycetospora sp. NBRC 106375]
MRRAIIVVSFAAALSLGAAGGVALAAPSPNGHNCAGSAVSGLAGPGFGGVVSGAAHEQAVDNFGLADCGQTNRNNP